MVHPPIETAPEFRRGACHLSAGENQGSDSAEAAVSLRAERIRIADLRAAKMSVRGIALELDRAPSTISREIRRNSDTDGRYRPHQAELLGQAPGVQTAEAADHRRHGAGRDCRTAAGSALEPGAGGGSAPAVGPLLGHASDELWHVEMTSVGRQAPRSKTCSSGWHGS